jgi:hypothetical protein
LKRKLLGLLLALVCCACDGDFPYSRRYACHLMLNYELHSTSLVFAAVKSPGMYVSITTKGDGHTSVRHVYVTGNEKGATTEDIIIRNDDENYRTFQLGRSNETGLIVGCTNFAGPVAYDRSCPNCDSLEPLDFTGNRQQVSCGHCSRTYLLDTGGIVSGNPGEALLLYSCQFNGTWLVVTNGLKT